MLANYERKFLHFFQKAFFAGNPSYSVECTKCRKKNNINNLSNFVNGTGSLTIIILFCELSSIYRISKSIL